MRVFCRRVEHNLSSSITQRFVAHRALSINRRRIYRPASDVVGGRNQSMSGRTSHENRMSVHFNYLFACHWQEVLTGNIRSYNGLGRAVSISNKKALIFLERVISAALLMRSYSLTEYQNGLLTSSLCWTDSVLGWSTAIESQWFSACSAVSNDAGTTWDNSVEDLTGTVCPFGWSWPRNRWSLSRLWISCSWLSVKGRLWKCS
jgi:hypothetical protein